MDLLILHGLIFYRGGYTYRYKNQWFKVNLRAIFIPYILWGAVGLTFALTKATIAHDFSEHQFSTKIYKMITGIASDNYPLWFLVAFLVSKSAYDLINLFLNKIRLYGRQRIIVEIIIVVLISSVAYWYTLIKPFGHSIMRFDTGLVMLPFFTIGHYLPKFMEIVKQKHLMIALLLSMFAINLISGMFLNKLVSVNSNDYGDIVMFFISTVSGTIAVYLICMNMEKIVFIKNALSYIGYNSLIILCSQTFFLFAIGAIRIFLFPNFNLAPIVQTILCLLLLWPCVKPLRRLTNIVQNLKFNIV